MRIYVRYYMFFLHNFCYFLQLVSICTNKQETIFLSFFLRCLIKFGSSKSK